MNLKQFKMTNNDEIICEIVEDSDAEDGGVIVIRKALRILTSEDYENNIRYYSFKPLLSFQDDFEELVVMNVGHVICESLPSKTLVLHYARAVKEVESVQSEKAERNIDVDKLLNEIEGMDDDEVTEYLQDKLNQNDIVSTRGLAEEDVMDSDAPNIIQFKPKGTMH